MNKLESQKYFQTGCIHKILEEVEPKTGEAHHPPVASVGGLEDPMGWGSIRGRTGERTIRKDGGTRHTLKAGAVAAHTQQKGHLQLLV